ncbi:SDR family NAD(P)-dependent oxidoreductase [Saccharicrinis sp. GN24d3]|uniref:SDR family NAD(P)-dependent oxidoreductase n=1 Tax=Saccharicrinis sp. GN24d3 TaxID=3458416 RepID=UPI0040359243
MKNYLIVGGSSGIGKSIVEELKNDSDKNIWATYNTSTDRNWVNDEKYIHMDVTSNEYNIQSLPDTLDGLVYCPGTIRLKPFDRIKPEDFIDDYQIQLLGAVKVVQQLLPKLKKVQHASVVFFSTVAVSQGFKFHSLVSASKGAVEGLTKALAAEYAPAIRFNCIAPSLTNTPLAASMLNTEAKIDSNGNRHPLKRIGNPKDIADMAVFLLSEKASWITGQVLHVDGGISTINI